MSIELLAEKQRMAEQVQKTARAGFLTCLLVNYSQNPSFIQYNKQDDKISSICETTCSVNKRSCVEKHNYNILWFSHYFNVF